MKHLVVATVIFSALICLGTVHSHAAAPLDSSASGLVFAFRMGSETRLDSLLAASRRVSRSPAGSRWTAKAIDPAGKTLWTEAFRQPLRFHLAPSEDLVFSVVLPRVEAGTRVEISNTENQVAWSKVIDRSDLAMADQLRSKLDHTSTDGYAATAKLHSSAPSQSRQLSPRRATVSQPATPNSLQNTKPSAQQVQAAPGPSGSEGFIVSGSVVPGDPYVVRAYDAATNRYVISSPPDWYGENRFELPLPAGNYVFEVDTAIPMFNAYGWNHLYRAPTRTQPIQIAADTVLPVISLDEAMGTFALNVTVPCNAIWGQPSQQVRFLAEATLWTSDGSRAEGPAHAQSLSPFGSVGTCEGKLQVQISPGTYSIALSPTGWPPRRYDDIVITDGNTTERSATFLEIDRTLVWNGRVVDEAGHPIPEAVVQLDTLTRREEVRYFIDESGEFSIPYLPGWTAAVHPPLQQPLDTPIWKNYSLNGPPPSANIVIEQFGLDSVLDNGLVRLNGDGDRDKRLNVLFLADGYSAISEPFTDTDGDGEWDGFVWYDLDHDGVRSAADLIEQHGDPQFYAGYGEDPTLNNEPFTDSNGDGVPNFDDPGLFLVDARGYLATLLGSDFWDIHRDSINVFALFEPSSQAGYSVVTEGGTVLSHRSTRYESTLHLEGNSLNVRNYLTFNNSLAVERALSVLPEVDVVIILANHPIQRGRIWVTGSQPSLFFQRSGSWVSRFSNNQIQNPYNYYYDAGFSHFMGHAVGPLCDEWFEFSEVHPMYGSVNTSCPNVSFSPDLIDIPWANRLPNDFPVPSRTTNSQTGVFEGGDRYSSGAYSPSLRSIMSFDSLRYNEPSRAALETVIHSRTGEWRDPADASGRCARLPTNAIHRRDANCQ